MAYNWNGQITLATYYETLHFTFALLIDFHSIVATVAVSVSMSPEPTIRLQFLSTQSKPA